MKRPSVGNEVRSLRVELGLTQRHLSEGSGIEPPRIIHIEKGRDKASTPEIRLKLATGFGLQLEDFEAYLRGDMVLREAVRRAAPPVRPAPEARRTKSAPTKAA
jgi:transcriptional regulator with XRE-family HTH domain